MNFIKLFIVRLFIIKLFKSFAPSNLLKQNKQLGFSLIGVMLAAAIGLIVATGISQLFANMATQLKQLQNQQDSASLVPLLKQALRGDKVCLASLNTTDFKRKLKATTIIKLKDIKKDSTNSLYDLTDTNLLNNHGLTEAYVELTCASCTACPTTIPATGCTKDWKLNFVSQSLLKGVKLFNKSAPLASMQIKFTDSSNFECNIEGGGAHKCLKLDESGSHTLDLAPNHKFISSATNGKSLVGCGTTQENTKPTSTALGFNAGSSRNSGFGNTFIGYWAGYKNNTGTQNTFIGALAGRNNTGNNNTFIGTFAGFRNTIGNKNTFIGSSAGQENVGVFGSGSNLIYGHSNTFLGYEAGKNNTTGYSNTFLGNEAGNNNTSGNKNTFIGNIGTNDESNNIFIGYEAGHISGSGGNNVFLGNTAGYNNKGDNNTFLGTDAGYDNSGEKNTFIGFSAGSSAQGISNKNTFLGYRAGSKVSGNNNIFIGNEAGSTSTIINVSNKLIIGRNNWITGEIGTEKLTVKGKQVCLENTDGISTCGSQAPECLTLNNGKSLAGCGTTQENTQSKITAFGFNAGSSRNVGVENTFIGYEVGSKNTSGHYNTFIGFKAGHENTSGYYNTFLGHQAGYKNKFGLYNTFLGFKAGHENTGNISLTYGHYNTFIGYEAGYENTQSNNTFIGYKVGRQNIAGHSNTFLGHFAGSGNIAGSNNIFIGKYAGYNNGNIRKGLPSSLAPEHYNNILAIGTIESFINENENIKAIHSISWIVGKIGTHDLFVNALTKPLENYHITNNPIITKKVCLEGSGSDSCQPGSSRSLKKNISLFTNTDKILKDLISTPLFNYEYKTDPLKKTRLGIISEDLPPYLQIKQKNKAIAPDWVSIYGSLWAGIQALYNKIQELKTHLLTKIQNELQNVKSKLQNLKQAHSKTQSELQNVKTELQNLKQMHKQELQNLKQEFQDLKTQLIK